MSDYLTTQQAAVLLGYDPGHVRRLLEQGKLVGQRWGRDWQIERASVAAWRESQAGKEKRGRKSVNTIRFYGETVPTGEDSVPVLAESPSWDFLRPVDEAPEAYVVAYADTARGYVAGREVAGETIPVRTPLGEPSERRLHGIARVRGKTRTAYRFYLACRRMRVDITVGLQDLASPPYEEGLEDYHGGNILRNVERAFPGATVSLAWSAEDTAIRITNSVNAMTAATLRQIVAREGHLTPKIVRVVVEASA
jgi:excisionase family DNA binding protein